jgi:hypothetical protein
VPVGSLRIDYFIHAANILLLAAYSVRDILWLRLFAVASSLIAMPYFLLQPTPLWAAFGWSVLFTGINLYQTWHLLLERRPVKLTADEEAIRRLVFRDLHPRKVLQVISIGSWTNANPGDLLIEHGRTVEAFYLIIQGKVQLLENGRSLGELGEGEIVGSALLLTGAPSEIDAVVVDTARVFQWKVTTLERFLNAHPDIRDTFQRYLSRDLAGKVKRLAKDAPAPSLAS